MNSDNFYENLKKLRLEDNFIVKSISTTLLNRVSQPNICFSWHKIFINAASICELSNILPNRNPFVLCPLLNCLSLRVQRGSGSRNWLPGSAVTSRGPWTRLKTGRKKSHASTPSYWYKHGHEIKMGWVGGGCCSNPDLCCVFHSGGRE